MSEKNSSTYSTTTVVGAVAAVVGVVAVAVSYKAYAQDKASRATKRAGKKGGQKRIQFKKKPEVKIISNNEDAEEDIKQQTVAASSDALPPQSSNLSLQATPSDYQLAILSDQALSKVIQKLLQELKHNPNPEREAPPVLHTLRHMDMDSYRAQTRISLAQWLVIYYSLYIQKSTTEQEYIERIAAQASDMLHCWELLQVDETVTVEGKDKSDLFRAGRLLKVDVAQRLKDMEKMNMAVGSVLSEEHAAQLTSDEVVAMFPVTGILGRWSDFKNLGEQIQLTEHGLGVYRELSQGNVAVPDYSILFDGVQDIKENYRLDQIAFEQFNIIAEKMRLIDVECPPNHEEDLRNSYENGAWIDIPEADFAGSKVGRTGGVCQLSSPGAKPVPMVACGPCDGKTMSVRSYIDVNPSTFQATRHYEEAVRIEEHYVMTRAEEEETEADVQVWVGTYTTQQGSSPQNPHKISRVMCQFEIVLKLKSFKAPGQ